MCLTIILAAGLKLNHRTKLPSVLDNINGKPWLYYHIKQALTIKSTHILIVVGKYRNLIEPIIEPYFLGMHQIYYIDQMEDCIHNTIKTRGTGDAIKCCLPFLLSNRILFETNVLIIHGNGPLLSINTIKRLLCTANSILVAEVEDPSGYGRIIMNADNTIAKIVEDKECKPEESSIKLINYGAYNIHLGVLNKFIPDITNRNKRKEYYLPDIVEIASNHFVKMTPCEIPQKKPSATNS
jgi:bifunctional N-acetylglucosamine-1-phosphate-uridyltransferase/glucosamine-1-phosphate-acetyltransferase GlmU-like protein